MSTEEEDREDLRMFLDFWKHRDQSMDERGMAMVFFQLGMKYARGEIKKPH